ncbi:MAG: DUF2321 domain-containing protein [Verrucomicrobia bacterium]|nr:DUF2321 domain-containing protein [Verrucomicrobiota bacterium]
MAEGFFDTAQICKNGHVVNDSMKRLPAANAAFCAKCGEPTISECESCHASIRGYYQVPGVIGYAERSTSAPGFCHQCGKPYPWTERRLQAALELVGELDELAPEERETLRRSLGDLARQGPATDLAAVRSRRILKKLSKEAHDMARSVIFELLSESARKTLFGS